jgi:hypothetical protein
VVRSKERRSAPVHRDGREEPVFDLLCRERCRRHPTSVAMEAVDAVRESLCRRWRPESRSGAHARQRLCGAHLAKPWRTSQQQAIYVASRINQLRKSSSAASQSFKNLRTPDLSSDLHFALSDPISCGFFFGAQEHPDARICRSVEKLRLAIPVDQSDRSPTHAVEATESSRYLRASSFC